MVLVKVRSFISVHRKFFTLSFLILLVSVMLVSINYVIVGRHSRYNIGTEQIDSNGIRVGIVFGGGVFDGRPSPLIMDRLDAGAELIKNGTIKKLIVSGDNRFVDYNEPESMKNYLVNEKRLDPNVIQLDNAGRSTYETCERARKVFELNKVVLVSESTHLPRAIYTCRSFGIEAYGYTSDGQSSAGLKVGQRFREILARTKASINIYIVGEKTVLGSRIEI